MLVSMRLSAVKEALVSVLHRELFYVSYIFIIYTRYYWFRLKNMKEQQRWLP